MAQIKLANGVAIKELRIWDGSKWIAKTGRICDGIRWLDFIRPGLTFKDDFITQMGLSRYNALTNTKSAINAGATILPVQSVTGFYVGQEVTITEGLNSEEVRVVAIGSNSLTVTPLLRAYPTNSIIARSNSVVNVNELGYPIRKTYTIT